MRRLLATAALGGMLLASSGCNLQMPNLLHPGGLAYQRWRGAVYDPFPQNNIGPVMDGGRPYGTNREATDPPESQRTANNLYQRFGPPPQKYNPFVP